MKNISGDKPITAIPTVYNGVQMRSRMEAHCAVLFDKLGWEWRYEPFSLMLPGGTSYIPDFWIENIGLLVECRGYDNKRGRRQIDTTVALVEVAYEHNKAFILPNDEGLYQFLVIGPEDVNLYHRSRQKHFCIPATQREQWRREPGLLMKCDCGWQTYGSWCPNCEKFPKAAAIISVLAGKVFLNGLAVEDM